MGRPQRISLRASTPEDGAGCKPEPAIVQKRRLSVLGPAYILLAPHRLNLWVWRLWARLMALVFTLTSVLRLYFVVSGVCRPGLAAPLLA